MKAIKVKTMGATLNIKDPEAYCLAQAIAQETGEPITRIVVDALRDRLSRIERQKERASVSELLTITGRAARLVPAPCRPIVKKKPHPLRRSYSRLIFVA